MPSLHFLSIMIIMLRYSRTPWLVLSHNTAVLLLPDIIVPRNTVVVQSLNHVPLFVTQWTEYARLSWHSLSPRLLKLMSSESVMPSNYFILRHPLLSLPSIFNSIKVFSNELALHIRWPKYWSFSFNISLSMNIQGWFPLGLTGLISLLSKRLSRVFPSTTIWKHQFFSSKSSWWFNFHYSVSNYFQMYNTLSLAYSNYKYLSEHKCLDNKDQCKRKPWNLIGIGLGKAVRQRNKLR